MMKEELLGAQESTMDQLQREGIIARAVRFTTEECDAIETIVIENEPEHFDYYGSSESELETSICTHLNTVGANTSETVAAIGRLLARLVEEMKTDFQQAAAWVTLRIFLPTTDLDTPRWHSDGHYLKNDQGEFVSEEYKLVLAIKGAPTRFQGFEVKAGQAVMYRVGEPGKNVHSEPEIKESRIFMSVVVGSEAQIAELKTRFE